MPTPHERLDELAAALERTMRADGAWTDPPPPLQPFRLPFAMDSMPFEHWLQLVLVPRMREIAATGAPLPMRNELAAHAARELDGRDDLHGVVDVLRAIDDLCPAPPTGTSHDNRRLGVGLALILLVGAWAFVAVWVGERAASASTALFPARVLQTYTGSIAPDTEFRPLRITVVATVAPDGSLRVTEGDVLALRSLATMNRGPTGALRFLGTRPPTAARIVDWLANVGVTRGPAAERAANEALQVVAAAVAARTRGELHDRPRARAPVESDALVELPPTTPGWVAPVLTVIVLLGGAIPITTRLLRFC